MNIVYCRSCSPKKVLAVGPYVATPADHYEGETLHDDTGVITVQDDPQGEGEIAQQYLDRIQAKYQEQMV